MFALLGSEPSRCRSRVPTEATSPGGNIWRCLQRHFPSPHWGHAPVSWRYWQRKLLNSTVNGMAALHPWPCRQRLPCVDWVALLSTGEAFLEENLGFALDMLLKPEDWILSFTLRLLGRVFGWNVSYYYCGRGNMNPRVSFLEHTKAFLRTEPHLVKNFM